MSEGRFSNIEQACRLVAGTYYGGKGLWLCNAFDAINKHIFDDKLPYPHIILALTAHGKCQGWSRSSKKRPPTICLHPSAFGGTEKDDPWGIPSECLGYRFAFDILLHECMHVSVNYCLGGAKGPTSHNNPQWISEVNRIAPLIGFNDVDAGMSKTKRVQIKDKSTFKPGRKPTKVVRTTDGNIQFSSVASFPIGLRKERGEAYYYYTSGKLPIKVMNL